MNFRNGQSRSLKHLGSERRNLSGGADKWWIKVRVTGGVERWRLREEVGRRNKRRGRTLSIVRNVRLCRKKLFYGKKKLGNFSGIALGEAMPWLSCFSVLLEELQSAAGQEAILQILTARLRRSKLVYGSACCLGTFLIIILLFSKPISKSRQWLNHIKSFLFSVPLQLLFCCCACCLQWWK